MTIFGTRPEAIKLAPLILAMKKQQNRFMPIIIETGQHKEMLQQVLVTFGIQTDYDLAVMKENQTLTKLTEIILNKLESILRKEKPDIVLVHGDTTTALAASLAAFYQKIPLGHVEAGLRTRNKYSPYPEEMNRQLIDGLSDLYFAPTELSKENLIKEQRKNSRIFVTGNTAIDALNWTVQKGYQHEVLHKMKKENQTILVTMHRRENLGRPMENICKAILNIVQKYKNVEVVFPVHLNPKVREVVYQILGNQERIFLVEPLDVADFHNVVAASYMVLTDSGGIQEEAPFLEKPVLVLRDVTERPEGVKAGSLKLVGTEEQNVQKEIERLLVDQREYERMAHTQNPYGDGKASEYILAHIIDFFKNSKEEILHC